jgi:hypothetical protein
MLMQAHIKVMGIIIHLGMQTCVGIPQPAPVQHCGHQVIMGRITSHHAYHHHQHWQRLQRSTRANSSKTMMDLAVAAVQ